MSTSAAIAAERRIYNPVQRDAATFLETREESGGTRTLIEVELAAGGGNAPHRHVAFAERFKVAEGALTVRVGDDEHTLGPGDTACAPLGTLHCFANRTDEPVRFIVELLPGHRGFEQALQIAYGLAEDGLVNRKGIPRNLAHLALLVELGDTRVAGPLKLLEPVMGLLARRARRRGIDAQLIERYCQV
jgi:mannose-6-phosphate isomerase-like protein (cupin superfamily)